MFYGDVAKMTWKVKIEGDKQYLDDLNFVFETLHFGTKICKDGEEYFLEGTIFENAKEATEVSEQAKTFLTLIQTALHFKSDRAIESIKIVRIFKISEDRKEKEIYDTNGNFKFKESGKNDNIINIEVDDITQNQYMSNIELIVYNGKKIKSGLDFIESIKEEIQKAKSESEIKEVENYLTPFFENITNYSKNFPDETTTKDIITAHSDYETNLERSKWAAMRNIYESIRNSLGGKDKIYKMIGEDKANNFYNTACYYYLHPENKDPNKYEKPKRKISLVEAEEIISLLISQYIEEKVKPQRETK